MYKVYFYNNGYITHTLFYYTKKEVMEMYKENVLAFVCAIDEENNKIIKKTLDKNEKLSYNKYINKK